MGNFVKGANCWVRVGSSATDAVKVGFVDSFNGSKNSNIQRVNVCGEEKSVALEGQAITANVSMTGFLPTSEVAKGTKEIAGYGKFSITKFNPEEDAEEFAYIDFYDEKQKKILAYFTGAKASSFRISGNAGSYSKSDVSMEAIDMKIGPDYKA